MLLQFLVSMVMNLLLFVYDKATTIKEMIARIQKDASPDFFEEFLCMTLEEVEKRLLEETNESYIELDCLENLWAVKVPVK